MLTTIGRSAIRRAGGRATKSWGAPAYQGIWQSLRVDSTNSASTLLFQPQKTCSHQRAFATATTTKTAKPKSSTTNKLKTTTTGAKSAAPTTKAKATKATKKPVKKVVKKKKITKKAAKPKRRAKKPLTDDQKVKVEEAKKKANIKQLKELALDPPTQSPNSAWQVVLQDFLTKGHAGSFSEVTKQAGDKYKSLTPGELEEHNHKANQNRAANQAAYKKWVESHTPDQIRIANNARNALSKRSGVKHRYPPIVDPRIPKKPRGTNSLFTQDRWASGDLKGIKLVEATALLAKEWQGLSAGEKKVYEDRAAADTQRYVQEYKTVFGRDPAFTQVAKTS